MAKPAHFSLDEKIVSITGKTPSRISGLSGGCVGDVYRVQFNDGESLVAKADETSSAKLHCEGDMLLFLATKTSLPVPHVVYNSDTLLLMEYVEGGDSVDSKAEDHAAALLADLHRIKAESFGFDYNTLIGGLHQPNPKYSSWLEFFAEQRILYMAREAYNANRIPVSSLKRFETFAENVGKYIEEPAHPSLIHGDIWGGNVLARSGKIAAFIDPAIYYAHPEIELAFITLFSTFGRRFFDAYDERLGIRPGFFEERRDIYNLYPLLVHTRLFGGHYLHSAESILKRFGF
ncbi:MAG: fructosamine kinase family protein [Chlorobiales bacterium]|nr:fructosamine kinase family protein [Chlorobiales bacterium]